MPELKPGSKAPDFTLPMTGRGTTGNFKLSELKGRAVVLYFYPKDDTSGCTKEACDFNDSLSALNRIKASVIGISRDSLARHDKFIAKYGLKFPLLSDEEAKVCEKYGTWIEKSMYGRKYMGIDRATFLIGADGKIVQIWRKVKVPGHVEEVMAALKEA